MAIFSRATLIGLLLLYTAEAFQVPVNNNNLVSINKSSCASTSIVCLNGAKSDDNEKKRRSLGLRKMVSKLGKRIALLTPLVIASSTVLVGNPVVAQASAPVMAMPKAEVRDPGTDALENHQRKMQAEAQEELRRFTTKARQVEAQEGPAARETFEAEYKANQVKMATERLENIEKLKGELLDQGICPFIDIEGQRQIIEIEKGVDLGAVAGTPFNVELEIEKRNPQRTFAYRKAANREVLKCMVQDMKNRDIDPVEYFKIHQDKTQMILEMPAAQAAATAVKYSENIELYGQIVPPKEGEISAKERLAKTGGSKSKEEAKRLKAEAKAKAAAERAATKAKVAAEKAEAKAEKKAAKAAAKAAKEAAKQEKEAAAAVATAVAPAEAIAAETADEIEATEDGVEEAPVAVQATTEKKSKSIPIVPVAAGVVAVGGGGYALKFMRDKAAANEEDRQRQLQLLMGGMDTESTTPSSAPALEEDDTFDLSFEEPVAEKKPVSQVSQSAPKKKKQRGFFGKKKSSRETDINALVGGGAKAPEFAKLLAKILVFGAPGRFPNVIALAGDMPMEKFDFEAASEKLVEAQVSASISKEEAAEIFANVVNCMLIDIVDLASASLKEKDSKLTVEAIGIVVDYMNHAASLYNSIAEGVVITPVTYGGDLAKGKLEQMYSAYAVSGMTNLASMEGDFDDRVSLLQDVFQINEKKAEGLMMKAMQKNMMEMMKSGEGMEGMEEMMGQMGGLEGLGGGLGGADGEEPDPEQLRMMLSQLKELKDSGSIPPSELEDVKKQFKEMFGSSIDQVMKDADKDAGELSQEDKDMLELMKSILDD
jgi:hypothetical protein